MKLNAELKEELIEAVSNAVRYIDDNMPVELITALEAKKYEMTRQASAMDVLLAEIESKTAEIDFLAKKIRNDVQGMLTNAANYVRARTPELKNKNFALTADYKLVVQEGDEEEVYELQNIKS